MTTYQESQAKILKATGWVDLGRIHLNNGVYLYRFESADGRLRCGVYSDNVYYYTA